MEINKIKIILTHINNRRVFEPTDIDTQCLIDNGYLLLDNNTTDLTDKGENLISVINMTVDLFENAHDFNEALFKVKENTNELFGKIRNNTGDFLHKMADGIKKN